MPGGRQQRQWSCEGWELNLRVRKEAGKLGRGQSIKVLVGTGKNLVFNSQCGKETLESLNKFVLSPDQTQVSKWSALLCAL